MNYPLISEYIEAIKSPEDNFDKLSHLKPVLDTDGNPIMSSGNFAVVFKMTDGRKDYAIKCFTREQEGREKAYRQIAEELDCVSSAFLCPIKYLENELFVDAKNTDETEFPVLQMDWVEGMTLDNFVRENRHNEYVLDSLTYNFCRMAQWLLTQPFAHGDLKPDNILVRDDGSLVIVDYDGIFVPTMKGEKARELGSPNYRHPLRTEEQFDEHIDDFALASIALALKAIALKPELYNEFGSGDKLLFSEDDFRSLGDSKLVAALQPLMDNSEFMRLYGLFMLSYSEQSLTNVSFRLFKICKPEKPIASETISTTRNWGDLKDAYDDEFGVKYSNDGKRLLYYRGRIKEYSIPSGTKAICDWAFSDVSSLQSIIIPESVICIGIKAFYHCTSLQQITIPKSVTSISDKIFYYCISLQNINIPDSVVEFGREAFWGCFSLKSINIPKSVISIGDLSFYGCKSLISVTIPNSVKHIGSQAFRECISLRSVYIPNSVKCIKEDTFSGCESLQDINIPDSITHIGERAFHSCKSLQIITIPESVTYIGSGVFANCNLKVETESSNFISDGMCLIDTCNNRLLSCHVNDLSNYLIPPSVTSIGNLAFCGCKFLRNIILPKSVVSIGDLAFCGCKSVKDISIPASVSHIGDNAFIYCEALQNINIPKLVTSIQRGTFSHCSSLQNIKIPNSVTSIEDSAFEYCSSLQNVKVPDSVISIGEYAFSGCSSLLFINLPTSLNSIEKKMFLGCESLESIIVPDSVTSIGDGTFDGCTSLKTIKFPKSVEDIGEFAFCDCTSLQSITILNSMLDIANNAFYGCDALDYIYIPKGSRSNFEELLPDYKDKLVEIEE